MKKTALVPAFGMPTSGSAFRAAGAPWAVHTDVRVDVRAAGTRAIPGPDAWSPPIS